MHIVYDYFNDCISKITYQRDNFMTQSHEIENKYFILLKKNNADLIKYVTIPECEYRMLRESATIISPNPFAPAS